MAYIRQIQIHFETQRFQFQFDFSMWHMSAILCLFCCSMTYIRQWEIPLSIETSACLRQRGAFITAGYTLFALKDATLNRFQFSSYRWVRPDLTERTVKFRTISIKNDRENEGYVTKTDFVR